MLIWLASYPRSGNTMVRLVLDKNFGLATRQYRPGSPNPPGTRIKALPGFREALGWDGPITDPAEWARMRQDEAPHIIKTHTRPGNDDAPALYLVRDGRDALVSYAHYLRDVDTRLSDATFADVLERLILGQLGFGSWSEHVAAWRARTATAPTSWLRYEDLRADPSGPVAAALRTLGVAPAAERTERLDFADYQSRWPKFFRKGKVGGWRDEMPDSLARLFWEHHGAGMESLGYARAAA